MTITAVPQGNAVIVTVSGELDIATVPALRSALRQAVTSNAETILDLSQLAFCDYTGLRALRAASATAHQYGHRLLLRKVPRQLAHLLDITDMAEVFHS